MFRYAVCNELFHDRPMEEGVKRAADLGYTGLEVAPFTLAPRAEQYSPEQRKQFRAMVESHGMTIIGLHWLLAKTEGFHLTTRDKSTRNQTADYLGVLAELCADLGGKVMVLGSPQQRNFPVDMSHDEASAHATEVLIKLVPKLEEFDVTLAVEPLGPGEGNFLNQAKQARDLIDAVGSPFVRLHLDVKAMSSEAISISENIRQNSDLLAHFHANDPNLLGPGMGEVDFKPIFGALTDVGYAGWVSVEVFDYKPGVERILLESIVNMRHAAGHAVRG